VHPASGTAPGVLVWPDIFGLRPAFRQMGKRLAESGYSVIVVNPFYRTKKAPTADAGSKTPIPQLLPLAQGLNETTHMTDAKAFIGWLDRQPSVAKNRKIGTQGYCKGGPIAFRTAAAVPDRVGAVASFHGGGLATEMPNSPHLQAAKSKAQFLIEIAENDDMRSPNEKNVLKETFAKANLPAEIEVYAGAAHGWCPPDSTVYNEPQAEKAWSRLLALYGKALA
jgi:carboxymethylenebutenolidase